MPSEFILWVFFALAITVSLVIDLGPLNRIPNFLSLKQAFGWTMTWVTLALLFGGVVFFYKSQNHAIDFATAYVLELSLSVDNLFVFILLFRFFKIEAKYQHRILFWGVLGAIVFRAIFIFAGIAAIQTFHWILLVFSVFLVYMGIKIIFVKEEDKDFSDSWIYKISTKALRVTKERDGQNFFIIRDGIKYATPLMVTLVSIEFSDIAFAVDSIPVVLAVSSDPLVVFTSNIFAVLGLRSMYFLISGMLDRLKYLHYGLGFILVFVGIKILYAEFFPESKISSELSLVVVSIALVVTTVISLLATRKEEK